MAPAPRGATHVLGVDLNRAHCNHPLFENADDPIADDAHCFADPGRDADDGLVCAPPLVKAPCADAVAAWGIPRVYC